MTRAVERPLANLQNNKNTLTFNDALYMIHSTSDLKIHLNYYHAIMQSDIKVFTKDIFVHDIMYT